MPLEWALSPNMCTPDLEEAQFQVAVLADGHQWQSTSPGRLPDSRLRRIPQWCCAALWHILASVHRTIYTAGHPFANSHNLICIRKMPTSSMDVRGSTDCAMATRLMYGIPTITFGYGNGISICQLIEASRLSVQNLSSSKSFWRSTLAPQFSKTTDCTCSIVEWQQEHSAANCCSQPAQALVVFNELISIQSLLRASVSSFSFRNCSMMSAFSMTGQMRNFTWKKFITTRTIIKSELCLW